MNPANQSKHQTANTSHLDEPEIASRRRFLAQGAAAGLAMGLMGGVAHAQEGKSAPAMAKETMTLGGVELYPGAIDAEGAYWLPPLPYAYEALEPLIDAETMHLHHDKHHAGYVKGLIAAEEALAKTRQTGDYSLVAFHTQKLAFHGGGHFLHCLFWAGMAPMEKGGKPSAELTQCIDRDFGSHKIFEDEFFNAAKAVEGSGWGILSWSIPAKKLTILQTEKHNNLTQWGNIPLLVVDVWEHAYYKKYGSDRPGYIKAFQQLVNWTGVSERYQAIRNALG